MVPAFESCGNSWSRGVWKVRGPPRGRAQRSETPSPTLLGLETAAATGTVARLQQLVHQWTWDGVAPGHFSFIAGGAPR